MARRGWTLGAAAAAIVMGSGFESQAATAPRTAPPSSTRSAKAAPPKGTGKPAKAPAAPRPVGGAAPGRAPAPRAPAKAGGGAAQTAKPAPPTVVPPRGTPGSASALPQKGPAPAPKGAADAPPVPMAAPVGKPEPDRPSAEAPRTAVLPLEVAGNIRASRPALERALATGLGGVGAALLPADETARRLAGRPPAARCRDEACWRELGAALGVSRLVGGAVTRSEGQFIVDLQLVDGGSGRTLREKRGRCDEEYCSVADLVRRSAAELASARVADAAPAASPELPPRAPVGGGARRDGPRPAAGSAHGPSRTKVGLADLRAPRRHRGGRGGARRGGDRLPAGRVVHPGRLPLSVHRAPRGDRAHRRGGRARRHRRLFPPHGRPGRPGAACGGARPRRRVGGAVLAPPPSRGAGGRAQGARGSSAGAEAPRAASACSRPIRAMRSAGSSASAPS